MVTSRVYGTTQKKKNELIFFLSLQRTQPTATSMSAPTLPRFINIDQERAASLIGLRVAIPDYWWPEFDTAHLNKGKIMAVNFTDAADHFWEVKLDDESPDDDTWLLRYDAVLLYADQDDDWVENFNLPNSIIASPEHESVVIIQEPLVDPFNIGTDEEEDDDDDDEEVEYDPNPEDDDDDDDDEEYNDGSLPVPPGDEDDNYNDEDDIIDNLAPVPLVANTPIQQSTILLEDVEQQWRQHQWQQQQQQQQSTKQLLPMIGISLVR